MELLNHLLPDIDEQRRTALYTQAFTNTLSSVDVKKEAAKDAIKLAPSSVKWDLKIEAFDLPPKLRLLLGDVRGGAKTPNMVKNVLKWRQEKPGVHPLRLMLSRN